MTVEFASDVEYDEALSQCEKTVDIFKKFSEFMGWSNPRFKADPQYAEYQYDSAYIELADDYAVHPVNVLVTNRSVAGDRSYTTYGWMIYCGDIEEVTVLTPFEVCEFIAKDMLHHRLENYFEYEAWNQVITQDQEMFG